MLELVQDGLVLAALFAVTPPLAAPTAPRLLVGAAVVVFIVRVVLALLGRTI